MLKQDNANAWALTCFVSSRIWDGASPPGSRVQYLNITGIEDYWSYYTASLSGGGTAYINRYTGALTYTVDDFAASGNRLMPALSHVYNALK